MLGPSMRDLFFICVRKLLRYNEGVVLIASRCGLDR